MAFDITVFRGHFPEFANETIYPDGSLEFWASVGDLLLNSDRWLDLRDAGLELFVAHNICLQAKDMAAVAAGGVPGESNSMISSQSVGPVSVSLDTAAGIEEKGGNYNLTSYGTRFLRLARLVGMGGTVV
jgi:hypothetical protein